MDNEITFDHNDPNDPNDPNNPNNLNNPLNTDVPNIQYPLNYNEPIQDPLNGNCPVGNFFYINDSINGPVNGYSTNTMIPNLNMDPFPKLNGTVERIMKINNQFENLITERFTETIEPDKDVNLKKNIEIIHNGIQQIDLLLKLFNDQQLKVTELEKNMIQTLDSIQRYKKNK